MKKAAGGDVVSSVIYSIAFVYATIKAAAEEIQGRKHW